MELPELQLPEPLDPAKVVLDEEETEDLFYDCYDFLDRVLARNNPLWMQDEGLKLLNRLEETLGWHKIQ